jgi:hypothetical protein
LARTMTAREALCDSALGDSIQRRTSTACLKSYQKPSKHSAASRRLRVLNTPKNEKDPLVSQQV